MSLSSNRVKTFHPFSTVHPSRIVESPPPPDLCMVLCCVSAYKFDIKCSPHSRRRGYFQVSQVRVPDSHQGPSPPPAGRQGRGGNVAQGRGGDGRGGGGGGDQE